LGLSRVELAGKVGDTAVTGDPLGIGDIVVIEETAVVVDTETDDIAVIANLAVTMRDLEVAGDLVVRTAMKSPTA
jgi:hypothetical protein